MLAVTPLQNEHRENPKWTLGTAVYGRQATSVGLRGCRTGSIRRTKGHHFWTMVKGSKVITFLFQAALPSPSEFPACMQEATETITPTTIPYTVCLRVNNGFMDCCILALCKCCSDASLFFPNFRWNSFGTLRLQSFLSNQQSAITPIIRLQSNTGSNPAILTLIQKPQKFQLQFVDSRAAGGKQSNCEDTEELTGLTPQSPLSTMIFCFAGVHCLIE